jgi:hypothetical protein
MNGSAAKRINIFEMDVRQDNKGVDLGIWKSILQFCPVLDVHSVMSPENWDSNTETNDGKAVAELDAKLRKLDPTDPVKYDLHLVWAFLKDFS